MTKLQRENISRLIEKISRQTTTEDLIAFVADNFGMLHACQEVVNLNGVPAAEECVWFERRCRDFRVVPQVVRSECVRLTSIFHPKLAPDEQYHLLGLNTLASIDEVKRAYRKLSFRYHPDRAAAGSDSSTNAEKFIAICRAYKKITQAHEHLNRGTDRDEIPSWKPEIKPHPRLRKRKSFFLIAAIAVVLLVVSFFATRRYRHKAMLESLGHSLQPIAAKIRPEISPPTKVSTSEAPTTSSTSPSSDKTEVVKVGAIIPPPVSVDAAAVAPQFVADSTPVKAALSSPISIPAAAESEPVLPTPVVHVEPEKSDATAVVLPVPQVQAKKELKSSPSPLSPKPDHERHASVVRPRSEPVKIAAATLPPLRERVDSFLTVYTDTYERLNYNDFASLFTNDAMENNTLFKQRTAKYHDLFARLKEVSYTIKSNLLQVDNHMVYVSGHFQARLRFRDGHELNLQGPTSLLLSEDPNHHFKVRNLTYTIE